MVFDSFLRQIELIFDDDSIIMRRPPFHSVFCGTVSPFKRQIPERETIIAQAILFIVIFYFVVVSAIPY